MVITPHILTSVALSRQINNIYLIPFASFILHFLVDAIPHWDYHPFESTFKKGFFIIGADYLISICIIFIIGFFYNWRVLDYGLAFLASFFGILPDIITVYIKYYSLKNKLALKYRRLHNKIHFIKVDDFSKGFYQQVAVSLAAIIVVLLT